jgi:hypothetical protein
MTQKKKFLRNMMEIKKDLIDLITISRSSKKRKMMELMTLLKLKTKLLRFLKKRKWQSPIFYRDF